MIKEVCNQYMCWSFVYQVRLPKRKSRSMTILQVDDYRIDHTWGTSNCIVYLVFWIDDIDSSLASLADVYIRAN